jgi:hypothetical protein
MRNGVVRAPAESKAKLIARAARHADQKIDNLNALISKRTATIPQEQKAENFERDGLFAEINIL